VSDALNKLLELAGADSAPAGVVDAVVNEHREAIKREERKVAALERIADKLSTLEKVVGHTGPHGADHLRVKRTP
jgi:hypothetical protein